MPPVVPPVAILFSLASTGLAVMGVQVVLLIAFQNLYGYVYSHIALLVAVSMAGVAVGTWLYAGGNFPPARRAWRRLVILDLCLCAGSAVLVAVLGGLESLTSRPGGLALAEAAILGLMALAGLAGGAAVPLAAGLLEAGRTSTQYPEPSTQCPAGDAEAAAGGREGVLARPKTSRIASAVDAADCLGGAIGGAGVGLIVLPLLGWPTACLLLALLKLMAVGVLLAGKPDF